MSTYAKKIFFSHNILSYSLFVNNFLIIYHCIIIALMVELSCMIIINFIRRYICFKNTDFSLLLPVQLQ